jgi:Holliday junction resolvasome RuvABC endonuclease subunit
MGMTTIMGIKKKKKSKTVMEVSTYLKTATIMALDLSLKGSAGTVLFPSTGTDRQDRRHFLVGEQKTLLQKLEKRDDVRKTLRLLKPKGGMTEPMKVKRLDVVLKFLMQEINILKPGFVAIEDYAYGAKGQQFHIGELVGGMKLFLWRKGIPFRMYEPTSIKKYATGNGAADKTEVVMACYKDFKVDFMDFGKVKDNVADSYVIAKLLELELNVRYGLLSLEDLKKREREILQRTTKTYPVNILERPFIKEERG